MRGHFELRPDGVYYISSHPKPHETWICARLEVISYSRDERNEKWAKVVRFRDADGKEHEVPLPEALLVDNGTACRRLLSSRGLKMSLHRDDRELLLSYISSVEPSERIRSVQRLGWFGDVFVFPDEMIGKKTGEIVKWQGQSETDHPFKCNGSLDDSSGDTQNRPMRYTSKPANRSGRTLTTAGTYSPSSEQCLERRETTTSPGARSAGLAVAAHPTSDRRTARNG